MISRLQVDAYFDAHLSKDKWEAENEQRKDAAVVMANIDITVELQGAELNSENQYAIAAVAEQALFLVNNPNSINNPIETFLESESVDGIGSRSYRGKGNGSVPGISSRAIKFINMLRGTAGAVRLSRG